MSAVLLFCNVNSIPWSSDSRQSTRNSFAQVMFWNSSVAYNRVTDVVNSTSIASLFSPPSCDVIGTKFDTFWKTSKKNLGHSLFTVGGLYFWSSSCDTVDILLTYPFSYRSCSCSRTVSIISVPLTDYCLGQVRNAPNIYSESRYSVLRATPRFPTIVHLTCNTCCLLRSKRKQNVSSWK